jgi:LmbE family N-acetylglucosaminyl deacetylase
MKSRKMSQKVLVLAAHPDDETYGVGGTIARHALRGDAVSVLILTDGVTARHNATEPQKLAARKACAELGVQDVRFAGLPDQRLDGVALLEVIRPIERVFRELEPQVLYTHHRGDSNQDHRTVFAATLVAARPVKDNPTVRLLCYEVASATEWGPPCTDWVFSPNVFVDVHNTLDAKLRALDAYRETFQSEVKPYPHPRSSEAVRIFAQHRGVTVGLQAAEAFVLLRELIKE